MANERGGWATCGQAGCGISAPNSRCARTRDDSLPRELLEHIDRLRLILPVISVSVMALNRQDAESDTEIAFVLHAHACEPLDQEIERIEAVLASCIWRCWQEEVRQ